MDPLEFTPHRCLKTKKTIISNEEQNKVSNINAISKTDSGKLSEDVGKVPNISSKDLHKNKKDGK